MMPCYEIKLTVTLFSCHYDQLLFIELVKNKFPGSSITHFFFVIFNLSFVHAVETYQ